LETEGECGAERTNQSVQAVAGGHDGNLLSPPLAVGVAFSWLGKTCERTTPTVQEVVFQASPPRVLPVSLAPLQVKTVGFQFPESPSWRVKKASPASASEIAEAASGNRLGSVDTGVRCSAMASEPSGAISEQSLPKRLTRIRPPQEVVKLQDRLYFLLQPPLEHMVGMGELTFPVTPFAHQFDGIAFLFPRYAAILADEMGLGKTMQAITAMRMLLCSGEIRNILLVCPKPLVSNWQRELRVWAPEIPIAVIEGDSLRRQWLWRNPAAPIKIANYELLMRDRELLNSGEIHFDLVTLDEAQRIKNRNSATSEIVRGIPRTRSWALTGTPIENSPEDLVGIFEFLSPGFLSSEMNLRSIAQAAGDYILRRTKDKVLKDMPPKMFRDAEIELTAEQWASYQMAEKEGIVQLRELEEELTIQHVFELVLRLKQICNFDPATGASSKLERLVADMEEIAASGQKAIVFSQWVSSLQQIRPALEPFQPVEYHGRIPQHRRDQVIDRFRDDPDCHVILMSYGAGSVGLNLQFSQYVFLFDRWWNPAVEDQAINRAHRIGATGPVTITRMLAANTIEQRIAEVLESKRQMFEAIFSAAQVGPAGGLTRDEIFGLFNLRTPQGPISSSAA